jgi:hypothetical protein
LLSKDEDMFVVAGTHCTFVQYEGSFLDAFLTPNQRSYYNTLKKLSMRKPVKIIDPPRVWKLNTSTLYWTFFDYDNSYTHTKREKKRA